MNAAARMHLPELSFGAKLKRLYNRAFYLPGDAMYAMIASVEAGGWGEAQCIQHIDEYGDWV